MLNQKKNSNRPMAQSSASRNQSYKNVDQETRRIAILEGNIGFLIQISKKSPMPITTYFLEKALESLLDIETN